MIKKLGNLYGLNIYIEVPDSLKPKEKKEVEARVEKYLNRLVERDAYKA